jgi:nucleotide-binding universal stress UspA family protein
MSKSDTSLSVVVGVDGSRAAVRAATWAVDEAVSRDIPIRLVHVVDNETGGASPQASSQSVLHDAQVAVEATATPVKIETDIARGRPLAALVEASRSAAMVCVGPIGLRPPAANVGSTAAGLVSSAHCPVAIVRGRDRLGRRSDGWVVVEADDSPAASAVLQQGVEEARLRGGRLQVITTWQPRFSGGHDDNAVSEVRAQLDRRLAHWTRRHPDLEIRSVAVPGTILDYLAKQVDSVQLVVVGKTQSGDARELVGPAGHAALHHTECSVLVVCPRHL